MADGLTARKLVREHLETHFDEYLSSVSSYLRQTYPELHLTEEASQEIAATVIVRVSHADLDPTHVERALTDGADEMIRRRRPRVTHSRRGEELGGPLRAEAPRPLPSLRLIQSFGKTPANTDGASLESNRGAIRREVSRERADRDDLTTRNEDNSREESGGEKSGAEKSSDALGSRLLLANPPPDLGATIGWKDEPRDEGGRSSLGNTERDAQGSVSHDTQHTSDEVNDRANADEATDGPLSERFDAGSLGGALFGNEAKDTSEREVSHSSVPPTQGSVIPPQPEQSTLGEEEVALPTPRTRRKKPTTKTSSKATRRKPKAASTSSKSKATAKGSRPRGSAGRGEAAPLAGVAPPAVVPYVSDDLAVIAMVGFPGNPRRAAKLCVTAMAEELGLDDDADLSEQIVEVTGALEDLRNQWAQSVPPDAHLVWQKRARQATLRAFLGQRG